MTFFAPKDFKKGRLIMNRYRKIDILIVLVFAIITIPTMLISLTSETVNIPLFFLSLTILIFVVFFVQPFHIYHNFLVFFSLLYRYFRREKKYIWYGIVKYQEFEE